MSYCHLVILQHKLVLGHHITKDTNEFWSKYAELIVHNGTWNDPVRNFNTEVISWIEENGITPTPIPYWAANNDFVIAFKTETDRLLFRMRWI